MPARCFKSVRLSRFKLYLVARRCSAQANAVANKILDLRKCKYAGADLSKKVLAGALLSESDLSNSKLIETVLTKASCTTHAHCLPSC